MARAWRRPQGVGGNYQITEVKDVDRYPEALTDLDLDLDCYHDHLEEDSLRHGDEDDLSSESWAVIFPSPDRGPYYAWAPQPGVVLFARKSTQWSKIPQWVEESAHETGGETIAAKGPIPSIGRPDLVPLPRLVLVP